MADTVEAEGQARPGPWSPRLAAPRPTICSTSVGPAGYRCASHRGRPPGCGAGPSQTARHRRSPPPQSRARPVFGSAAPTCAAPRCEARLRPCPPRTAVAAPCASEAPRGLHHSNGQSHGEWRRRPAGPVSADRRRQHLELWCGRATVAAPFGLWANRLAGHADPCPLDHFGAPRQQTRAWACQSVVAKGVHAYFTS